MYIKIKFRNIRRKKKIFFFFEIYLALISMLTILELIKLINFNIIRLCVFFENIYLLNMTLCDIYLLYNIEI